MLIPPRRTHQLSPIMNIRVATCLTGLSPIVGVPQALDRTVLSLGLETSNGKVGLTYKTSTPYQVYPTRPPAGAPNVVIVMLDDVGFGAASTFGGLIDTPSLDKLAAEGLRYNCFNTTSLCSPSRAVLLTGRNHHKVGTGAIIELATGYDGYNSIIPKSAATIATVLQDNGYSTAAYGKWHNTPFGRPAQPGRLTAGRRASASMSSTASWPAKQTSIIQVFTMGRHQFIGPRVLSITS